MANQQHLDILKQGVDNWNKWREKNPHIRPDLSKAHLEASNLIGAHLEEANLEYAHLEGADLLGAHLEGANCCRVFFDVATRLNSVSLSDKKHGSASLADVSWGDVNLSVINWRQVKKLGDEDKAVQRKLFIDYQSAVRANRQVATALRDQGLNRIADGFAYRAQRCDREVLKWDILLQPKRIPEHKWILRFILRLNRNRRSLSFIIGVFLAGIFLLLVLLQNVIPPLALLGGVSLILLALLALPYLWIRPIPQLLLLTLFLSLLVSLLGLSMIWLFSYFLSRLALQPPLYSILLFLGMALLIMLLRYLRGRLGLIKQTSDFLGLTSVRISAYYVSFLLLFGFTAVYCGRILFSLFLDILANYGYNPQLTFFWYGLMVCIFAGGYAFLGNLPLFPDSFILSLISFHGRGLFPNLSSVTDLHNSLVVIAAVEAVVGLFIEISLIATFTQRYFGR